MDRDFLHSDLEWNPVTVQQHVVLQLALSLEIQIQIQIQNLFYFIKLYTLWTIFEIRQFKHNIL